MTLEEVRAAVGQVHGYLDEVDAVADALERHAAEMAAAADLLSDRPAHRTGPATDVALMAAATKDALLAAQPDLDVPDWADTLTVVVDAADALRAEVQAIQRRRPMLLDLARQAAVVALARGVDTGREVPPQVALDGLDTEARVEAARAYLADQDARERKDKGARKREIRRGLESDVAAIWRKAA